MKPCKSNVISFLGGQSVVRTKCSHLCWGRYSFVVFLCSSSLNSTAKLMSLFSYGCSSFFASPPWISVIHAPNSNSWLVPFPPQGSRAEAYFGCSSAYQIHSLFCLLMRDIISISWMPLPTVCTNLSIPLTWLSHNAPLEFPNSKEAIHEQQWEEMSAWQWAVGNHTWEEKSQSRAQGWMTL